MDKAILHFDRNMSVDQVELGDGLTLKPNGRLLVYASHDREDDHARVSVEIMLQWGEDDQCSYWYLDTFITDQKRFFGDHQIVLGDFFPENEGDIHSALGNVMTQILSDEGRLVVTHKRDPDEAKKGLLPGVLELTLNYKWYTGSVTVPRDAAEKVFLINGYPS